MRVFDKHPSMTDEQHIDSIIRYLRRRAVLGIHDGTERTQRYLQNCRVTDRHTGTSLCFTRDNGYHTSGWWKNPDYERCWHLSLGFWDVESSEPTGKNKKLSNLWVEAAFGGNKTLLWAEPPYSQEGKKNDIWHYRLFVHDDWETAILPRGEVYTRTWTPADWKSWSDLQAEAMIHTYADIGD